METTLTLLVFLVFGLAIVAFALTLDDKTSSNRLNSAC